MKRPSALTAAVPSVGIVVGARGGLPRRDAHRVGVREHARERRLADPALGRVGDPRERAAVGGVDEEGEVVDRVLDLGALVELRAADDLVADLRPHEHVLEHARLRVRAVEDGQLAARHALVHEPLDLRGHEAGLGVLVGQLADLDRVALPHLGPQVLGLLPAVVGDQRVRRRQDHLRGAVVLLQLDHGGVDVVLLEVEDVGDVGAAEAVDRLRVVADDREVAVLGGEQLEPAVLGVVGVLVLVDEHPAERVRVAVADLLEQLEQVDRAEQQVVEVHRVGAVQLALVALVDVGDGLLEERADELAVVLRGAELVLRVGDLDLHRPRREPLGVDVEVVQALLDQPPLVGRVVDRELARVAEPVRVRAQHARAGGVERHHPHRARRAADEQLDPVAHLLRRLVRERDGEDLVRPCLARAQQVGDPVGEHARLARAGAGQDEQGPGARGHGLALGRVEPLQERVDGFLRRHPQAR